MSEAVSKNQGAQWVIAGGTLLACLLAMYLIVGLNVQKLKRLHVEEQELAGELESLTQLGATVNAAEIVITTLGQQRELLARQLPITVDFGSFYGALAEAASASGASLETVSPAAVVNTPQYLYLPVEIQAAGEFPLLHDFLYRVMHLQRLAKIEKLTLTATGDPGACQLNLTLHIFASVPEGAA